MDKSIKILIVEDEQIVALDLKRRLTKLGYQITGMAANGNKALALVKREQPNIVLMDIHIQGDADGVEVAAMMQKMHSIPVIYLTAYSEEKTLSRARETRPYGYLLKPFSDRELHVMIQISIERYERDMQITKNEQHFRLALEAAHLGTWEIAKEPCEVFMRKSSKGNLEPLTDWKAFFQSIDKHDKRKVFEFIERLRSEPDNTDEIEFRVNSGGGQNAWYKLYGKSFRKVDDLQIVGILQETTESRRIINRLAQAATIFKCATEGIVILRNRQFDCANNAFFVMTQYQENDLKNQELPFLTSQFLGKEAYERIWQSMDDHDSWQGEIKAYKKNNEIIYAWLSIGRIPVRKCDEEKQFIVMVSDITAVREAQEQLSYFAYYDNLTNLPNRMLVMDRLKQALAQAARESLLLGVLFIDIDNFKRVNDTLGHKAGDSMLCHISQKMLAILRQSDTLGRLGGDEFVVIVTNADSRDAFAKIAEKILNCLSSPIIVGGMEIVPSCSIGISVYPDHSDHHDGLVQMADTAMYEAKSNGRNRFLFYHPSLTQRAVHYLTREHELHLALEREEFLLYYQPQLSASELEVTGVEALIRWQHPVKGLLSPAEIIPVAEVSGLILAIGNWVLREACRQLSVWRAAGFHDLRISVNISIRQFSDNHLPLFIAGLLAEYHLPAHLLELEITESCLQNDLVNITCLQQLEKLGVSISIDDFGTGYSCMSSLKNLPIHRLKIDQSFIKDIPQDKNDCAIAAAILALSKELNLKVVAEGIETSEQVNFLNNLGCNDLQGFLFGKPVAPEQIPDLIRNRPDHPTTLGS
ncbi:MAG: EAL domain-containing protein [Nitrosomonas sp.]|nr:EAL domain-containing protein [Nitrosomonas sp.]MCW5607059.1 EAL domain-containing protein [Nitrosomonas sp.]